MKNWICISFASILLILTLTGCKDKYVDVRLKDITILSKCGDCQGTEWGRQVRSRIEVVQTTAVEDAKRPRATFPDQFTPRNIRDSGEKEETPLTFKDWVSIKLNGDSEPLTIRYSALLWSGSGDEGPSGFKHEDITIASIKGSADMRRTVPIEVEIKSGGQAAWMRANVELRYYEKSN